MPDMDNNLKTIPAGIASFDTYENKFHIEYKSSGKVPDGFFCVVWGKNGNDESVGLTLSEDMYHFLFDAMKRKEKWEKREAKNAKR